jgi:hypothetical protein
MDKMYVNKIKSMNLPADATVTLTYSDGTDVFVHNETAVDTAIADTDVISEFASLVVTPGLQAEVPYVGPVLETMRSEGYLDDYERGSFEFEQYIADTLRDNFYDQEFIDSSVKQYDYKRGFCTLETTVTVPVQNFIEASPYVGGWKVSVQTPNGTLTLD